MSERIFLAVGITDYLDIFYQNITAGGLLPAGAIVALLSAATVLLIIQLYYYLGVYGGLARYRNLRSSGMGVQSPPVSVIVVVRESHNYFVEHGLIKILEQEYESFEVVVVDCSYNEEIGEMLGLLALRYEHMYLTQIKALNRYDHSTKLAITVGIKAARHEHLIFTTADAYPPSSKWLSLMAKGFIGGDVVLGYSGVEKGRGPANRLMRCSRLGTSVRWLSAAIHNRAYRGTAHNLGYTKSLYFAHKGFNHLNMNIGEDDLFIREIATRHNVSVVMNPNATVREIPYGGLGWWASSRKYFSHSFRYYPAGVRFTTGLELWSRALFFATIIAACIVVSFPWNGIPLLLVALRAAVVMWKTRATARRLGERKLMWAYLLYDLYAPLTEAGLYIGRTLRPDKGIWR